MTGQRGAASLELRSGGRSGYVRAALLRAGASAVSQGMPAVQAEGQLIRPLVASAALMDIDRTPIGFWDGVLAVQLAHEASLVHDDIVDSAAERRGAPTLAASRGIARALVHGDHLLTAAYRAAARTENLKFVTLFARAVERTVAGEAAQGRATGERLDWLRYREIALGKSGELLGCALAIAPLLEERGDAEDFFELGRRLGLLYQMLDDLLDYCPLTDTGKPAMGDYGQRRWTWVLEELPELPFGLPADEVLAALHRAGAGGRPIERVLSRLEEEAETLRSAIAVKLAFDSVLGSVVEEWMARARFAVMLEVATRSSGGGLPARAAAGEVVAGPSLHVAAVGESGLARPGTVELPRPLAERREIELAELRARVPALVDADGYLARHSRSFRFACRYFSPGDAKRIGRVYAYCRVTDDLVDEPPAGRSAGDLLDVWAALSKRAYEGEATGLPLLDEVMKEMAGARVPFAYAEELIEGMRMDLRGERYRSVAHLRLYTYRVASVVGLWVTRLFGYRDPAILEAAERMGHAMQLTNILRDVGEDWRGGRLYLPADLLRKHALDELDLAQMEAGSPIRAGYRALVEAVMELAEADYRAGLDALTRLPPAFARPAAIAAHVYRGIHADIRRNGYDNFRRRAYTDGFAKLAHAVRALWELRRAGHRTRWVDVAGGRATLRMGRIAAKG